jgi:hypothetical protein
MAKLKHLLFPALLSLLIARPVFAEPLSVPFDFSRSEIAVAATIRGAPATVFIDSGVDPSTIDLARAKALHLKLGQTAGEVSGTGGGKSPPAFAATIDGFVIAGRIFPGFDAVAVDLGSISKKYGRPVDAVIGFSFLHDKSVLIDYPAHTLELLAGAADASAATGSCRIKWAADLRLIPGENWPSFAAFRLGAASVPVTIDTGSNSHLMLYQGALGLPGLRASLVSRGVTQAGGFRGLEMRRTYAFAAPLGFGPFSLPSGTPSFSNRARRLKRELTTFSPFIGLKNRSSSRRNISTGTHLNPAFGITTGQNISNI